eukprot:3072912-Rhodomonas_salina.1
MALRQAAYTQYRHECATAGSTHTVHRKDAGVQSRAHLHDLVSFRQHRLQFAPPPPKCQPEIALGHLPSSALPLLFRRPPVFFFRAVTFRVQSVALRV